MVKTLFRCLSIRFRHSLDRLQRYSVVFIANQAIGNYWIRADPDTQGLPGFDGGCNSAILRYKGAPNTDPMTMQTPDSRPMLKSDLHPLTNPAVPSIPIVSEADVNLKLNITFDLANFRFDINGAAFNPPTVPVLLQILSGAKSAQDLLLAGSFYALRPNKVIKINIPGVPFALGGPVGRKFLPISFMK
jgi:iron transport multicopper oxidase